MAEYGNNYDYGQSPFYKDDDTCPECDYNVVVTAGAASFAGIFVSV